jgi:rhamnosyltransferase
VPLKQGRRATLGLPKFAVCLAAFNGRSWLDQQLDSILTQEGVDLTLFVSVDRSTDGTEDLIDQRRIDDSRIRALSYGCHFGGAAANFFRLIRDVDLDGFDYVSLSDQDDIWFPDKLSRASAVLSRTGADGYSSDVVAFWPSGRRATIRKSQSQREFDFLFEAAGPGCTYVLKIGLVRELKLLLAARGPTLREVGLHDWFIYAFARSHRFRWVIDDKPGMLYRQHSNNQVGVNLGWRAFTHRVEAILNGWGTRQATLIATEVGFLRHPIIERGINGGRIGRLWLALNAGQCRRRMRDRMLFRLGCLALAFSIRRQ